MSNLDPSPAKGSGTGNNNRQWRPAGSYSLREEPSKDVIDGLNGTVLLDKSAITAVGAGPGDEVRVRAKANEKSVEVTRSLHKTGDRLTLPSEARQKLQLSANDEVELEVAPVENGRGRVGEVRQETIDKTQTESDGPEVTPAEKQSQRTAPEEELHTQWYAVVHDSFTCHFLQDKEAETTVCDISLAEREHSKGEEPGDMLELCLDCRARVGAPITNEEWVEWLSEEVGFEQSGGPPAYFNKKQLISFGEYVIESQERITELQERITELEKQTPTHGGAE